MGEMSLFLLHFDQLYNLFIYNLTEKDNILVQCNEHIM